MTEDTSGDTSPVPEGFKVDHRRRYIISGNTNYMLPSDDEEINRLDFQHYILRKLFHGNFNAPVEDALSHGIKVLDAGCGAGCWTMNMANDFPNSHFVGVDVADLFPKDEVKSNCIFVKANTLEGLPFEDDTFDYIFQRFMVLAFTPADWAKAISELVRVTKPGGWVELVESDCKLEQAPPSYLKFQNAFIAGTRARGFDIDLVRNLGSTLDGLLVDVEEDYISCPMGWNGRVGDLLGRNAELGHHALKPHMAPIMGLTSEEYDEFMVKVRREFRTHKSWMKWFYVYGMKP